MFKYKGKTALVTGASSGIGAVFARELAARGTHVVLVARSDDKLRSLAQDIRQRYCVRAVVFPADLSQPEGIRMVYDATRERGLAIDILINNAGFATHGPFETLAPERDHEEVMLNVTALVDMTHAFVPQLVERGDGAIINVGSTGSFQPVPYMAVYGATKAFVLSFSEALWEEYRRRGLRVLALCPGATSTAFFNVVGTEDAQVGRMETPEKVVATALRALERRRSFVVSGWSNYLLSVIVSRLLPRSIVVRVVGRMMQPKPTTPNVNRQIAQGS